MKAGQGEAASAALIKAIRDPRSLANFDTATWERVLSCARRNAVLAFLGERAGSAGVIDDLPDIPRDALLSARTSAARIAQLARWELDRAHRALRPAGIPMIALKGVAYILRGMPHAATRLLSDIDIMVPRDRIIEAEQALLAAGWRSTNLDAYDQRYYREWSHEIPPLSRLRPDPEAFWANSESQGDSGVRVLSPVDTVLHAAVHLFFDSDFAGRFRDLVDLHELLEVFGPDDDFWPKLVSRGREQGLGRPLYYALQALSGVLGTPVPAVARQAANQFRPPLPVAQWMNRTLAEVLVPIDPQQWPPAHRRRLWLLYVRSHWLRMPAHLLVPHLVRKSMRRVRQGAQA